MKKRYTSDPKQASRRNAFANHKLKKSLLILLGFLLLGGGMKAIGQTAFELNYTSSDNKTYYVTSTDEVAISANNNTESGPQAYKFYVSESSTSLTDDTKYDHFYNVRVNNANATVTFIFQTTKPVGFSNGTGGNQNAFRVTKGTLIMKLDKDHYDSDITLRRVGYFTTTANTSCPFHLINDEGVASHQKLIIEGLDPKPEQLLYQVNNVKQDTATYLPKRQFVIDGAANISSVNMTDGNPTYTGISNKKPLFRIETGTLHLTNVTIQNSINDATDATHGGIYLMLSDNAGQTNRNLDVILTHCWLHNIVSTNFKTGYPGIGLQWQMRKANGSGSVVLKRSKFSSLSNNNGQEAAIRSTTGCKASVTIDSCNINNNFGGGIRWQGLVADPMQVKNTTIKGNYTKKSGGGIMAKSPLVLTACKILNNTAYEHGGGINYMCYDEKGMSVAEAGMIYPRNLELTMDAGTLIDGNKALTGYGGGLMIWGRLINLTATDQMGYVYHEYNPTTGEVVGPYKILVEQNGATISNNEAYLDGGGIFIYREAGTGTDPISGEAVKDASCYFLKCQLNYGNITGNKTTTGNGGGLCIKQTGTPNLAHVSADHPAQDIEFYTGGNSTNMTISDNDAHLDGGGIYLYSVNSGAGWNSYQIFNTKVELNDKTLVENNKATNGDGGGIYLKEGTINLEKATIGGNDATLGNKALTGNGGGIYVNSGSVKMLSSTIKYNVANSSGGGVYTLSGDVLINHLEAGTQSPSNISYNTANLHGGGIYNHSGRVIAYGSFHEDTDYPIQITHNTATTGSGGGIFCMGNSGGSEYDIRLRRINISNNAAASGSGVTGSVDYGCGGGIYLQEGKISVINGTIDQNTANIGGGGVYTHVGDIDINPTKDERHASKITNNTAGLNGGGLNTHSGHIRIYGNSNSQRILITGNQATTGSGGALFCYGNDINEEYFTVRHADLVGNKAKDGGGSAGTGVTAGCGGGMYLQKGKIQVTDVHIQNNYAILNGGGINNHSGNIDVDGCVIGASKAIGTPGYYDGSVTYDPAQPANTNRGNKAGQSGGGIYTNAGNIEIEDYLENAGSLIRYQSEITYNEAAVNGGGIDTRNGIIYVNHDQEDDQIEITYNKAAKGGGIYANAGTIYTYNALIDNNIADENGGGINNHSGDIYIYGGSLSNNRATEGGGGGAYTNVGDIDIMYFPYNDSYADTIHGTKIYNNLAKLNGGAINNHTGLVDVRYATMRNNTSTLGNGGAIYCEGPHAASTGKTIRMVRSILDRNKTRGADGTEAAPTGRGGGIYLKYGSIFAQGSFIKRNSATHNGGGINNHDGNIQLYGCVVDGNTAQEGSGGGIYTLQGDITTGPTEVYKATQIINNTAKLNGGGINNGDKDHAGTNGYIYLNGDHILNNTAQEGNGGGIYIANGTIDMYGGKIANNSANGGNGGGVYSGGGEFNIEKRVGLPVLDIIEVKYDETDRNNNIVHYHLLHPGTTPSLHHEHGFYYGKKNETPGTKVTYSTTDLNADPGCYKDGVCILTVGAQLLPATTYWVRAYAINDKGTAWSDTTWFTTLSTTLPTVYTGTVSNITSSQAEASGKVIDKGNANITNTGIVYSSSATTPTVGGSECAAVPSADPSSVFFTNTLTGLAAETKYYYRAYASNNSGSTYAYGDVASFTTAKNTPNMGTNSVVVTLDVDQSTTPYIITANASFTMPAGTNFTDPSGANYITAYGFAWSTDDDPELHADHTVPGILTTGTTTFTYSYTPVSGSTTFYVTAFASSSPEEAGPNPAMDITNYSITAPVSFTTPDVNGKPVVHAVRIDNITQTSANITGKLISKGSSDLTAYGIVWSETVAEPTVGTTGCTNNNQTSDFPNVNDEFTLAMTPLSAGHTYYVRAYAINDEGTAYSNVFSFTALDITKPNVIITSVSDITKTSANINCSVDNGGGTITNWGVKYNTTNDLASATDVPKPGGGSTLTSSTFTANLTSLSEHTAYYVWAYATNSAGTHTCQAVTFTTDYDKPAVVFTNPSSSNAGFDAGAAVGERNTVQAHYKVTPFGGTTVQTHGVCWSTFHNPTRTQSDVANTHFVETTSAGMDSESNCDQTLTLKYPNTRYFMRAYASTETPVDDPSSGVYSLANIVYTSIDSSFITLPAMLTGSATNIGNTSATLGGTIDSRDNEGHLVGGHYGVCWGTSPNPTRADGYYTEAQISSANSSTFNFNLNATTNITYGSTYHYRAYYKSRKGDIAYGADATFTPIQYGVTASANPAAGGNVSVHYNGGATDNCTVTAEANTGYTFTNWTESGTEVSTNATYTFTIGGNDRTLVANFTANTYTVTVNAAPAEGGSVTGGGTYAYGSSCTVTASANTGLGYAFTDWTNENGDEVSVEASYTFTVTGATTLTANFSGGSGKGGNTSMQQPRPRDIYPAPAREPWNWEDDSALEMMQSDTLTDTENDTITQTREQLDRALVEPVDIPMIDHNTAERGGGIFMAKNTASPAQLMFSGGASSSERGKIIYNYASEAGGGIYIDTTAHMQMKGHCVVNANHVPTGHQGGGIYLSGRLYVGETGTAASQNGLIVNQNFAMDEFNEAIYNSDSVSYTETNKTFKSNVQLKRHTYYFIHTEHSQYDDEANVITLLSDISDIDPVTSKPYSNIGFHVNHGFCPVVATSYQFGKEYVLADYENPGLGPDGITPLRTYETWLSNIFSGAGIGGALGSNNAIFEDTESYIALHSKTPSDPFHSKYIYLWGCWTHPAVLTDPETGSNMSGNTDFQNHYKITNPADNTNSNNNPLHWEIYSAEGLAWFSSYVNGLNAFKDGDTGSGGNHYQYKPEKNPYATAKLMNDIDLSAYYWVPIGSVTQFNGADPAHISGGTIFTDNNDHHFKGTIDGQGHTVTGIKCQYVSGIFENGLVGYLDGGTVKNVFIDEAVFTASNHSTKGYYIGAVAGSMEGGATISACEARSSIDVTNTVDNKNMSYVGGLVGEMTGSGNVVHSCMAMPEIIGAVDYMGGLVGEIEANNQLLNSFANACFPNATTTPYYVMNTDKYIGGLVGENKGTVANCYSRLKGNEPTSDGSSSVFGWLAGTNSGTIQYCYAPQAVIAGGSAYYKTGTAPTNHGTYTVTTRVDGKYGYKHRDHAIALASGGTNDYINNDTLVGGLQRALNAWVRTNGKTTYHPWMRTMASTINDDLPILNFMKDGAKALGTNPAYNAVGTEDGWYMKYVNDVNELLTTYAALTSGTPDIYLYDENTDADGTTPKDITVTNVGTTPPVKFEIHPDVGIKVSGAAASTGLNARVGVTLHNNRSDWTDPNWHLFSAAVEDPHIGLVYHTDDATIMNMGGLSGYSDGTYVDNIVNNASKPQHLDNVYGVRQYFDPPQTTWHPTNLGYFPTDTPYGTWRTTPASTGFFDLYAYSESFYHWINYKREGSASYMDHWHMDPEHGTMLHHKINYTNDTRMRAGMGFLTALAHETLIMADGKLNQGNKSVIVTHTPTSTNTPPAGSYGTYNYNLEWRRLNLIGNPYQSYLDFKKFCDGNSNIEHTYGTREDGGKKYIFYTYGESDPTDASQFIHPHQGFFVKVTAGYGSYMLNFTDAMRVAGTASSLSSPYRSDVNYPLVILNCYDPEGDYDKTKIEVNRPELGGGSKMHNLHNGNAKIYASFEGNDYQTLFTPEGVNEVPVRFEAMEDGVYTIKWETHNGNFHYLHLIDNLAGTDTDCLSKSEYKFEGKTSDYHSRFKLVFGCVGIEENDDSESDTNFAFINGEELFINGAGDLYMFDITGRCVMSTRTAGEQASVSLPKVSAGVYLLRLEGGEQVKIQKIIIQ